MKKLFIAFALLLGVQNQADAQFLQKLGNAVNKAAKTVDKVASTILGTPDASNNNKNAQKAKSTKQVTNAPEEKAQVNEPAGKQPAANSPQVTKTTAPKAQPQDSLFIIKDCSFAGIKLGMKMKDVPKSVPGVYDEYFADQADCSGAWSFYCSKKNKYDGTNPEIIVSDNAMDKKVDQIIVCAKGARIADTEIAVGVPISKVKNTPGLKPVEYSSSYAYGKNYWVNINDETGIIDNITIYYSYE